MRVDVRFLDLDASDSLRTYTETLLERKLGRLAQHVHSVSVRIRDINGPRGGLDKLCSVLLHGRGMPPLSVRAVHADPYSAVSDASQRVSHALRRRVDELRDHRKTA